MTFLHLRHKGSSWLELSPSPEREVHLDLEKVDVRHHGEQTDRTAQDTRPVKRMKPERRVEEQGTNAAARTTDAAVAASAPAGAKKRQLVRGKLEAALGGKAQLAEEVESALHEQLATEKEYLAQVRAIVFNLKASGEGTLRQKLLLGKCDLKKLPRMTADELLSDAKSSVRAAARRKAEESMMLKPDKQCETDEFTCEACSGTRTYHTQTTEMRKHGAEQKLHSVSHVTCIACGHTWTTR
mmetsp:Transcript_22025/g.50325  ORF Transcript_22025/g.50325 Transcript_22025/m.50325 type:complete len:241 (-) Transcript_22025:30-752(-)|eukprot:CAMPEP_0197904646 /NCGR_PEP_ID=MMETSP1439-20131203/58492_1 /TAXON_ID=66791 /ORGANISM="Gonyaulax spinifera, Strain CCMP409" /LENGTH=240 /DNA_ID=CAMNT_0043525857 /DNA_START=101 /DNA_END=823 /DNA_ORIENTATION=+